MELQRIGNRLIILVMCTMLVFYETNEHSRIVACLLAFIVSCVSIYTERFVIRYGILCCYLIMGLFVYDVIFMLPVILYEIVALWQYKRYRKQIIGLFCMMSLIIVRRIILLSSWQLCCLTGILGLSVWLSINCRRYIDLKKKHYISLDSGTELTLELQNKNRYLQEKQDSEIYTATLQERNRIAREIHDNVGHMLSRGILLTGAMITVNQDDSLKEGLANLKESLDEAMNSIRDSVHDLHDESLDLYQAMKNITKNMSEYEVNLEYDMTEEIPRKVKYCFIAIVREAVANFIRHSNGDKINMSFVEHPAFYQLEIEDNGTCSEGTSEGDGIGLENISSRVESLSGRLNIYSDKTGFRIFVMIPKK